MRLPSLRAVRAERARRRGPVEPPAESEFDFLDSMELRELEGAMGVVVARLDEVAADASPIEERRVRVALEADASWAVAFGAWMGDAALAEGVRVVDRLCERGRRRLRLGWRPSVVSRPEAGLALCEECEGPQGVACAGRLGGDGVRRFCCQRVYRRCLYEPYETGCACVTEALDADPPVVSRFELDGRARGLCVRFRQLREVDTQRNERGLPLRETCADSARVSLIVSASATSWRAAGGRPGNESEDASRLPELEDLGITSHEVAEVPQDDFAVDHAAAIEGVSSHGGTKVGRSEVAQMWSPARARTDGGFSRLHRERLESLTGMKVHP